MEIKRREWILRGSYHIWNTYFGLTKKVSYEGHENIPNEGPALLVPKHQSILDIPLEGLFLTDAGRRGHWVMKDSLPHILDYWGAIRVVRPKDIRKLKKEERRPYLEKVRAVNKPAMEFSRYLFSKGEVIVSHLEGERNKGEVGNLRKEFLDLASHAEEDYGLSIPVIPVGIEYSGNSALFSRNVYLRAGKPFELSQTGLLEKLSSEMARLSNIPV